MAQIKDDEDVSDITWMDMPALLIFWMLFIVVLLQFVSRYALNDSIGWTEEVARYLLILVTFIGSITCLRTGTHITLVFFYRYIPSQFLKFVTIIVDLILTLFFFACGYTCVEVALGTSFQNMASLPFPKASIYWAVALSFIVMCILSAWKLLKNVKDN